MRRTPNPALLPESDRELVIEFQSGNRDAYDEIYRRYAPRVRRICSRVLNNTQDIDEATQETFLKAYQALGRFNGTYQLGAWLARIASNVCVDHVRFKVRSAQLVALAPEHETLVSEMGPEEAVVGNNPRVDQAILRLAPLHAEALKLRALGGFSHEEMAGKLAMTPAQVKALLHRARTSFKKAWDKAEGWLAAPVLGTKGWLTHRSEGANATTNLMGAGPAFGPLFVERVAASAVMVVVALSGVSSSPVLVQGPGPAFAAPPQVEVAPHFKVERGHVQPPAAHTPQSAQRPSAAKSVTSLLGHVHETLSPNEGDDRPDDGDEGGVGTADTRDALKRVRRVVEQVEELVNPAPLR